MNAPHRLLEAKNLAKPNHRVAGHDTFLHDGQSIYKLVNTSKKTALDEIKFYEQQLPLLPTLIPFVPHFRGVFSLHDIQIDDYVSYMGMEDVTLPFSKPCVIDFKMGTKTYWYDAPEEKIKHELEKGPHQAELGFRISGMRSYRADTNHYEVTKNRRHVMALTPDAISDFLLEFYHGRVELVPSIVEELRKLKRVFEEDNTSLKFFCASLLVIYEGDVNAKPQTRIALIDFAHVKEIQNEDRDYGFIFGLEKLIDIHELLKKK
jgi:1D-myo-inositol-tetrakisphosphate 5-kinase/inositol-polyphosphate multikinase